MKRGGFLVSLAAVAFLFSAGHLTVGSAGIAVEKDASGLSTSKSNNRSSLNKAQEDIPLRKLRLSKPRIRGSVSLEESLAARRSVRDFTNRALGLEQIGQLVWAGQGITEESKGLRTAPSAGATYPIKLYLAIRGSVYVYHPAEHSLEKLFSQEVREALSAAASNEMASEAGCDIVIVGAVKKVSEKYGRSAWKLMLLEAGHIAQNIQLQAVSLGLGSASIGVFDEKKVAEILKLPAQENAIYIIPVGYSAAGPAIKQPAIQPVRPIEAEPEEPAAPVGPKRALLILLGNRFQYDELFNTQDVLMAAGVEVTIAGNELGFVRSLSRGGVEIRVLLRDVFVDDYDAIVFMTSTTSRKRFDYLPALNIVHAALNRGKLVGAIAGGVRTLSDAGVLPGVRVTGNVGDRLSLQRAGAIYTGAAVEQDGLIITGRGAKSASLFGRIIAEALTAPQAWPGFGTEEVHERPRQPGPIPRRY